jgi:hypothetical protein
MGYTISPVYNEVTGEVTDFQVDNGSQGYQSSDSDYVELEDGVHHVFEDVSIQEDYLTDYYDTLASSDERIPAALQWAAGNLSPEVISTYNNAVDNDDIDTINEYLELVLNEYSEAHPEVEESTDTDDEVELTEQDQQVIEAISEQLSQQEPLGIDAADEWDSIAQDAANSGDEVYAAVCQATASYHAGEISSTDAINWVLENFPIKEVARVYHHLTK